jgi:hypothetical protein
MRSSILDPTLQRPLCILFVMYDVFHLKWFNDGLDLSAQCTLRLVTALSLLILRPQL